VGEDAASKAAAVIKTNVVRNLKMKTLMLLSLYLLISSCFFNNGQDCNIPEELKLEIIAASRNDSFTEEDFYRVNNMLFEYEAKDSLTNLINCSEYQKTITAFFNSPKSEKRVLGYRLIGVAVDSRFNVERINRINSDENTFLKTWSSSALMANKAPNSSDHLFKLFSSYPQGLPVDILINKYVTYDSTSVKKTGWKFIDSKNRNEQILAIQTLSNFEVDKKLQEKLKEFLSSWDTESKGWVISSMAQQRMGNLKSILQEFVANKNLKQVIIMALENSPTLSDNQFAKQLEQ